MAEADPLVPSGATPSDQPATTQDEGQLGTAPADTGVAAGTTAAPDGETFFDPNDVPDELQGAYKNMQAAFTRRMQGVRDSRQKVLAYDAFVSDPHGALRQMAQQYGYTLGQAGQTQPQSPADQSVNPEWQPNTWEEVIARAKQDAFDSVMEQMRPVLSEVQTLRKSHIESQLDSHMPDWREYEEQIEGVLQAHPSLASDPVALARLALPDEVVQSRATQAALKKLRAKQTSSEVSGGSTSQTMPTSGDLPDGPVTFDQAVKFATDKLKSEGNFFRSVS